MVDMVENDYSALDRPSILMRLFHPRKEWREPGVTSPALDIMIPVEQDTAVGATFHMRGKSSPNLLFFHGNGEIVADYDDLGPVYERLGINFLPVDYRGYGRSTGSPTVDSMMRDCHVVFRFVKDWLKDNGYSGPLVVMGRSLGSASAIELATQYPDDLGGLIIESGFAFAGPLLEILGIDIVDIGFQEKKGFRNVDKIKSVKKPVLIIHAERDHIIPFSDAQALYEACESPAKTLVRIPEANHNDIFLHGISIYMGAVKSFVDRLGTGTADGR